MKSTEFVQNVLRKESSAAGKGRNGMTGVLSNPDLNHPVWHHLQLSGKWECSAKDLLHACIGLINN